VSGIKTGIVMGISSLASDFAAQAGGMSANPVPVLQDVA
jgi:hypothetical protein